MATSKIVLENKYWKFCFGYVLKEDAKTKSKCWRCRGAGYIVEEDEISKEVGGLGENYYLCTECKGNGYTLKFPTRPPRSPKLSEKFIEDLKNWISNYENT